MQAFIRLDECGGQYDQGTGSTKKVSARRDRDAQDGGKSLQEIANDCGCSVSTAFRLSRKYGLRKKDLEVRQNALPVTAGV